MVMSKEVLFSLTQGGFAPQEEMLEVARKKGKLFIGIPREIAYQETRVALVPDAVALLVNNGHRMLLSKKLNCVAFDLIIDDDGIFPVIRAMGEIAGGASISIAAELLSNVNSGVGSLLGGISGISPTEVIIIGAGTVGEFAARAAIGLGATVKVFDNSTSRLRRLQNQLGSRVFTSVIVPKVLEKHLKTADVAIGALRARSGRTPCIVTSQMVSEMKTGSVIIDVSIDQGG